MRGTLYKCIHNNGYKLKLGRSTCYRDMAKYKFHWVGTKQCKLSEI